MTIRERKRLHPKLYSDWFIRAMACKTHDNWTCQHCGVIQFTVLESVKGTPYFVYLHAAHTHEWDSMHLTRELITLCVSCHARYDAKNRAFLARVRVERLKHQQLLARHPDPAISSKYRLLFFSALVCSHVGSLYSRKIVTGSH
jgi:hypothetical protein